jgi:hypothetical protein
MNPAKRRPGMQGFFWRQGRGGEKDRLRILAELLRREGILVYN